MALIAFGLVADELATALAADHLAVGLGGFATVLTLAVPLAAYVLGVFVLYTLLTPCWSRVC